jgi:putative ABC transport system permease protein
MMNNRYFLNFAIQNIDKHRQAYVPYMVTLCSFVTMFYLLVYLSQSVDPQMVIGESLFDYLLTGAAYVFGAFSIFFLIYCNGFLIRPRTKEFGLLYLFGLSQRHMLLIMVYETLLVFVVSMVTGGVIGVLLSRLMGMILAALVKTPLNITQSISWPGLVVTCVLFVSIMSVILVINIVEIIRSKPVSLLQDIDKYEMAPWKQWALLVVGVICVVYSYSAVISMDSPQRAYASLAQSFIAVIIGTYCLFVSLSVAILQFLVRRPSIYYRTQNFITINWLLNRVRFNGIGLASVSMFSLVMMIVVTMTGVIYLGTEESSKNMYAADVIITVQEQNITSIEQLHRLIDDTVDSIGVSALLVNPHQFLGISLRSTMTGFVYEVQNRTYVGDDSSYLFVLITADQYNALYADNLQLAPGEVAVYSNYLPIPDVFDIADQPYRVVKRLPKLSIANYDLDQLVNAHYVVVHDVSVLQYHARQKNELDAQFPSPIRYRFGLDLYASATQELQAYSSLMTVMADNDVINQTSQYPKSGTSVWSVQSREAEKIIFQSVYGSLYFLGLFLGVLFIMSTALLIYYKQISEGYEDKQRFEIMQRIGMTRDEVRSSVDKHSVFLFFIPLIVAGGHFFIALHMMQYLLELFRIYNVLMLVYVALLTFLLFSIIYVVIYRLSARVYYNIVR